MTSYIGADQHRPQFESHGESSLKHERMAAPTANHRADALRHRAIRHERRKPKFDRFDTK
jgi:hypothetical protein